MLKVYSMVATPPAPYRSLPGPPGPESRKSLKRVSRGLPAPGSKKCPKQSRNSLRRLKTVYFESPETVSRLFRTLFGLRGREAPGDSFETLSGFRARRARETPVRGGWGCNSMGVGRISSQGEVAPQSPGEKNPHKHKYLGPVTIRGRGGGSLPVGCPGVKDLWSVHELFAGAYCRNKSFQYESCLFYQGKKH